MHSAALYSGISGDLPSVHGEAACIYDLHPAAG